MAKKTAKRKTLKLTETWWAIRVNYEGASFLAKGPFFRPPKSIAPLLFRTRKEAHQYKREDPRNQFKEYMKIVRVDVVER